MLFWLVQDLELVLWVALGTAATLALLLLAGWLLVRSLNGLRRAVGVAWRYGLANIARRGRESIVQVVAFGLGLMVLLLLAVVRNDLLEDWRASLPATAPNQFLVNIRPDDRTAVQDFFAARGTERPRMFPMIRARLTQINGKATSELRVQNRPRPGFCGARAEPDLGSRAAGRTTRSWRDAGGASATQVSVWSRLRLSTRKISE